MRPVLRVADDDDDDDEVCVCMCVCVLDAATLLDGNKQ